LLYGCEIWGFTNIDIIERVHLKFCKLLLSLKKTTPNCMVYGELGVSPLNLSIQVRMLNYWLRNLLSKDSKYSNILYRIIYYKYINDFFQCPWLNYIKRILDNCGLSNVWEFQGLFDKNWVSSKVKSILHDQFLQKWNSEIENSSKCICYKIFKDTFEFEEYLDNLEYNQRIHFCRFRTCNHKLPIETGRWSNTTRSERLCKLCNENKLGDEFHYILECSRFRVERKNYLGKNFCEKVNTITFRILFQEKSFNFLQNICKFIKYINTYVSSNDNT